MSNLLLQTDSYKVTHFKQYPPGSQYVHSYLEARGGEYARTMFFGLQYYLRTVLSQPITLDDILEANDLYATHFGRDEFNRAGWQHILTMHRGKLPVRIRAVPEGTSVPVSNVLMTVENTDPAVPWLTNFIETRLMQVWYPTTVATLSRHCRDIIMERLLLSGDPDLIDFKLHDFGYRGSTSEESAAIGGLAHLVNFKGSDTIAAIVAGRKYYGERMAGFSIPAAEHSTITSWGQANEVEAFRNMLRQYPTGLVAVVSDSYNIYAACDHLWGQILHDEVMGRQGTLVIRPDSGDPATVVATCLGILGERFGYTTNQKGYKVLDPHVRLIQGDGVNPVSIGEVLDRAMQDGWSADNIAFGMGGALLQKVNRDTCQFAFKASNIVVNGESRPVSKSPIGMKQKNSKPGRLTLANSPIGFVTLDADKPMPDGCHDVMRTVYLDGDIVYHDTLAEVRSRARTGYRREQ